MIRKFFPLDKNYLLEEAQLALRDVLLTQLIDTVKREYEIRHNPLGIADSFTKRVRKHKSKNVKPLHAFYLTVAGVYRYKFGDSQLEFVWDGTDHFEKYKGEWAQTFAKWTEEFCTQELFINAVLDLSVFLPKGPQTQLAENRMTHFMLRQFELKIHKSKGLVKMKIA